MRKGNMKRSRNKGRERKQKNGGEQIQIKEIKNKE